MIVRRIGHGFAFSFKLVDILNGWRGAHSVGCGGFWLCSSDIDKNIAHVLQFYFFILVI